MFCTYRILFLGVITMIMSCNSSEEKSNENSTYPDVHIVNAMKNVIRNGELEEKILLDTISDKKGLYGLGPERYLTGELLLIDGISYVSKVTSDSTMQVKETFNTSAPFFVYANVQSWQTVQLPEEITNLKSLEAFIDKETANSKRPFAFKLSGTAKTATIHVQNLPPGTSVSSPQEAHQGQVNYHLKDEAVDLVGFFSTKHQTIFTHHDSFMHIHLITQDRTKMGHLDNVYFEKMTLYLPRK